MPKLSNEYKQAIENLPPKELQKIVLKFARKSKEVYDFINIEYISKTEAEEDLFHETKEKINFHLFDISSIRPIQKRLASAIGKAAKEINHYEKVTKNKSKEAELLKFMLKVVFENYSDKLGTCWTVFDSKLGVTTNRLVNLITKKLHKDYFIEYEEDLNKFLKILHSRSNHLEFIFKMPEKIER